MVGFCVFVALGVDVWINKVWEVKREQVLVGLGGKGGGCEKDIRFVESCYVFVRLERMGEHWNGLGIVLAM